MFYFINDDEDVFVYSPVNSWQQVPHVLAYLMRTVTSWFEKTGSQKHLYLTSVK